MAAADRTFGALTMPSLGDGGGAGGDGGGMQDEAGGLTLAAERQVQERWDAISAKLATEGEGKALVQAEKNATSRRESVTAILGRVPMGPKELRSLNMVTAERRIIDVLLTIPRGPARLETLTDALTPPPPPPPPRPEAETAEGEDDEGGEGEGEGDDGAEGRKGSGGVEGAVPRASGQFELEDDVLVGDEEEVFTTPARLLAAVELAIKEARNAGDDANVVEELQSLRGDVAARCDFL